jgi:hypothetical protein
MKRTLGVLAAAVLLAFPLSAQQMIVNGTFDSDSAWTVYNLDSSLPCIVGFGMDDGYGPSAGNGPYLFISGQNTSYMNCLVWQALTLKAGTTYKLSGAFRDITPLVTDGTMKDFWSELFLSLEEPVDGVDYTAPAGANTDDKMSFNTWSGCGPDVDGTWEGNSCASGHQTTYKVPGTAGEDVTVYFSIKTGFWTDSVEHMFAVAIDNISLVPVGGSGVARREAGAAAFALYPNFPNPFNPSTSIRFSLPGTSTAVMTMMNSRGRVVRTLLNEGMNAGTYSIEWDGRDSAGIVQPSGMYFCRLESGGLSETRRMILMK